MNKLYLLLGMLGSFLVTPSTWAQNVGIGTTAPNASAALDIVSSSKGALLPRVSSTSVVSTPATGLIVFQTAAPAGYYYYDGTSWQQFATASGAAITASNGLTKTGANVTLGGTLTQATTLDQGGNNLAVTGTGNLGVGTSVPTARLDVASSLRVGSAASQLSQPQNPGGAISDVNGQSFTLPVGVTIQQIDVFVHSGSGTLTVYKGAPGASAPLSSQAVTYTGGYGTTTVVLATPVVVTDPGVYSFSLTGTDYVLFANRDVYAGGQAYNVNTSVGNYDLKFNVRYTLSPTLYAAPNGSVGIGTDSPMVPLDVAGNARLRGLTTAGLVTTDVNGNLGSTSYGNLGSGFILNQTSQQASSNFNISGNGVIGGSATVAGSLGLGTSAPVARLQVQPAGDADRGVQVGDNSSAGNLVLQTLVDNGNAGYGFLGFNGYYKSGEQRINTGKNRWRVGADQRPSSDLFFLDTYDGTNVTSVLAATTAGNVGIGTITPRQRLEVAGTIYSSTGGFEFPDGTTQTTAAVTATGASFIQNQTTSQAGSNFNISGTGTIGGNALVSGKVGIGTTAPNSSLQVAGSVAASIRTLGNGNSYPFITISDTDYTVLMTGNLNLPNASATNQGRLYCVLVSDYNISGLGYYLLQGNLHYPGNSAVGNSSAVQMGNNSGNYKSITVQSDGTQWWIVSYSK